MRFVIANQKGGCGKTTTTINIAAVLAEIKKRKTLVIDMDPQANLTMGLGLSPGDLEKTVYNILVQNEKPENVVKHTKIKNLDILPANIHLAGAEIDLVHTIGRESALEKAISHFIENYEYTLIDAPPSLGLLTINSLVSAKNVLIPVQCEFYALAGLARLEETINLIKQRLKPELSIDGLILTLYSPTKLADDVVSEVKKHYGDKVFNTIIHKAVKFAEAPSHGIPGVLYAPHTTVAEQYIALVNELEERVRFKQKGARK